MNISERIRELRKEYGLTLDELGKRTGLTRQTVHRYETGEIANIPIEKIKLLAKTLEVTPNYLLGWDQMEPGVDENELTIEDLIIEALENIAIRADVLVKNATSKELFELTSTIIVVEKLYRIVKEI